MVLRRTLAASAVCAALCACHGSSSGGGAPTPTIPTLSNLGVSALELHGQGELWLLEVSELDEGAADRNGDGDADDVVAAVYDLAGDSLTNLAFAMGTLPSIFAVGDVLVAFGVSEADQGATDLNGDGDADDLVLHVFDVRTGVTTSTGLAMARFLPPAIGAGVVAFAVAESAERGQDLNGNGAANDLVLHVYDSRTLLTTNAQRSVTSDIFFHDHAFGFTTDEASAGADLNGDGDQTDTRVFEIFDLALGGLEMVPLAIRSRPLAVNGDDWFLLADEDQMERDLNGDGDTAEGVFHEVHPHQHTLQSLGLTSLDTFSSTVDGHDVAFIVQEFDGIDRNGDGDTGDTLAVLFSSDLDQVFDPGLATHSALVFVDQHLGFLVDERTQDEDRNGDGDQDDAVLVLLERSTGIPLNLGLDALALRGAGGWLVFWRREQPAGEDWNGDGDMDDVVTFYWDPLRDQAINTQVASAGIPAAASSDWILLFAQEEGQKEDLNGDGDTHDQVYMLHDVHTRKNANLGVAVNALGAGLTEDGRGVLLVTEVAQGVDLNGDGDTGDSVLHRLGP